MFTVEKVSPFLLHLPDDIKPEELFNCIAQVNVAALCMPYSGRVSYKDTPAAVVRYGYPGSAMTGYG